MWTKNSVLEFIMVVCALVSTGAAVKSISFWLDWPPLNTDPTTLDPRLLNYEK
jgi:hypothetical protein